jgi:hypothetical protein
MLQFACTAAVLSSCSFLPAIAQPVPTGAPDGVGNAPADPGAPEIVAHRVNPEAGKSTPPPPGGTTASTPILYHSPGALLAQPTVYLIWYGNWNQSNKTDTSTGQDIIRNFLHNIGGSPYYDINQSYSTNGTLVTGAVSFGGEANDSYSQGSRLSDSKVQAVVNGALSRGALPVDATGLYFVLTSSDVTETSGFCTRYCGWHTRATLSGSDIKYSFVGNSARCLSACAIQSVSSPNNNPGVDGMVSVIVHELEETNTDPDLNAWFDSSGAENADKCAWTFGQTTLLSNGAYYNIVLTPPGGTAQYYLIQRNLYHSVAGDFCAMSVNGNGTPSQSSQPTP